MSAPRLNRRLMLEAPVRAADGAGGFAGSWAPLGEIWAEVAARSGTERGTAGMPVSSVAYRIALRAAPQGAALRPLPGQRFRDGARVFAIRAVAERGNDARYLVCFADEEAAV